jgi:hypothetical protein
VPRGVRRAVGGGERRTQLHEELRGAPPLAALERAREQHAACMLQPHGPQIAPAAAVAHRQQPAQRGRLALLRLPQPRQLARREQPLLRCGAEARLAEGAARRRRRRRR